MENGRPEVDLRTKVERAVYLPYPAVRLKGIRAWLNMASGQKINIDGQRYVIEGIYEFHMTAINTKYGWRESFTYAQIWTSTVKRKRGEAYGSTD